RGDRHAARLRQPAPLAPRQLPRRAGAAPEVAARSPRPMATIGQTGDVLCVLGDLVDDVVVWLGGPIAPDTDTPAQVFHRRGGSAANVAAFAAGIGRPVRFIGQVADDLAGSRLV